jgi:Ca2+-binding RTX toxin-like protein
VAAATIRSSARSNWSLTLGAGGSGTASINGDDTYQGIDGIIGGDGNNALTGNEGNNTLIGGDGSDTLSGGDGADFLDGGEDGDTLDGGKGADTFDVDDGNDTIVYNVVANLNAVDVVTGFDNTVDGGHDVVDLDALFDNLNVATGDRSARVSVVDVGSNTELRVDLDGNGSDETTILVFQGIGSTGNFTFGNDADNDIKLGTL